MSAYLHLAVRGEIIKISYAGAKCSAILAQLVCMPQRTSIIPLSGVTRDAVKFVAEFCERPAQDRARLIEPLRGNSRALRDIVICADFLEIPEIVHLVASTVDPTAKEFASFL